MQFSARKSKHNPQYCLCTKYFNYKLKKQILSSEHVPSICLSQCLLCTIQYSFLHPLRQEQSVFLNCQEYTQQRNSTTVWLFILWYQEITKHIYGHASVKMKHSQNHSKTDDTFFSIMKKNCSGHIIFITNMSTFRIKLYNLPPLNHYCCCKIASYLYLPIAKQHK